MSNTASNIFAQFQKAGNSIVPFETEWWGYNGKTDKKSFGKSIGSDEDGNKLYEEAKKAVFLVLYEFHALTKDGFNRKVTSTGFINFNDEIKLNLPSGAVKMSYSQAKDKGYDQLGRFRTYYVGYVMSVDDKAIAEPTVAVFSVAGSNLYEASIATDGKQVPYLLTVENNGRVRKTPKGEGGTLDYSVETVPEEQQEAMQAYLGDTVQPLLNHFNSLMNVPEATGDVEVVAEEKVESDTVVATATANVEPETVVTEPAKLPWQK